MGCITSERKTTVQADLVAVIAQIAAIDSAMSGGGVLSGTKKYDFDSGSGRTSELFSSPLEMITARQRLAATRDRLERELNGNSIIRIQVRR